MVQPQQNALLRYRARPQCSTRAGGRTHRTDTAPPVPKGRRPGVTRRPVPQHTAHPGCTAVLRALGVSQEKAVAVHSVTPCLDSSQPCVTACPGQGVTAGHPLDARGAAARGVKGLPGGPGGTGRGSATCPDCGAGDTARGRVCEHSGAAPGCPRVSVTLGPTASLPAVLLHQPSSGGSVTRAGVVQPRGSKCQSRCRCQRRAGAAVGASVGVNTGVSVPVPGSEQCWCPCRGRVRVGAMSVSVPISVSVPGSVSMSVPVSVSVSVPVSVPVPV